MTTSVEPQAPATAAEQFALRQQSPLQRVQHLLHAHPALSPLMVLIVACIAFTIINPRFAQPATISIILQQTAVVAALAIGQTLIILTAGIDLAVGAICNPRDAGDGQPSCQQRRTGRPCPAHRHRCRHRLRIPQRPAGYSAQPAAVHRYARHAEHLYRDRFAVLRGASVGRNQMPPSST